MLADTVGFIGHPEAPEETAEELECDTLDDEPEAPYGRSQALARMPRDPRVYNPRVGPRPVPKIPPLNDALEIKLDQLNPKQAPSATHYFYEIYKEDKTAGETQRWGASTSHVRFDVKKVTRA